MKSPFHPFWTMSYAVGMMLTIPAFAQNNQPTSTEQWQVHTTKSYQTSPNNRPIYHKTPPLKPAKKKAHNALRRQGWHTHPDPYIEEGGVYTHQTHPAVTQHGNTLHHYSDVSSNNYLSPPATVLSPYRKGSTQQAVKIQDPLPGNVAPIPLPAERN